MNITAAQIDALQALGYTEQEARFLYLVATHSGYFVARQFLSFTAASWGKRTTSFWSKFHTKKHVRTEHFPVSGVIYHLFSRRLYRQIDRENLLARQEHEMQFIERRIAALDFVLANLDAHYLETEPDKLACFGDQWKIPAHLFPSKTYHSRRTSQPTVRYFADKFPMFLSAPAPAPVVTFTYIQGAEANMTEFVRHLKTYLPLFRQLPEFGFLYLARNECHFERAKELFNSFVGIPLESNCSEQLLRYFRIRKAWELRQYSALVDSDLIFRNQAKKRFAGNRFENLYRGWKAERVIDLNIREEFGGSDLRHTIHFAARVLARLRRPEGIVPRAIPAGAGTSNHQSEQESCLHTTPHKEKHYVDH
jgi:hypothetical protein